MSTLDIIKALVERDGKPATAMRLGVAEASVYRWIRTGTAPTQYRVVKAIKVAAKALAKAGAA